MIVSHAAMAPPLRISLKYDGKSVDDGTMPLDEVVDALQGFAGAYGKIATHLDPQDNHQLRVSAVKTGSFELLIVAWANLVSAGQHLETLEKLGTAARAIFKVVAGVIAAKKHTKGKPFGVSVKGNNNTVILMNFEGAEISVPLEVFDAFKEKLIDTELNKIASPLRQDEVDSAELVADDDSNDPIRASITSGEREYFRPEASTVTTRQIELTGTLVSLNKEKNRGILKLGNDTTVRYHYIGNNPDGFHGDFSYKGPVRVTCVAEFDENLVLSQIEILSLTRLQRELPLA